MFSQFDTERLHRLHVKVELSHDPLHFEVFSHTVYEVLQLIQVNPVESQYHPQVSKQTLELELHTTQVDGAIQFFKQLVSHTV